MDNYKAILIGEVSVGKSSIVNRLVYDKFDGLDSHTIGASFFMIDLHDKYGKNKKLHLWDTAGQERFNSLIPLYIRNVDIVLAIFDLSNTATLYKLLEFWIPFIESHNIGNKSIKYNIIGNKMDLIFHEKMNEQIITNFYSNINYFEVSAKTGVGVKECFEKILNEFTNNKYVETSTEKNNNQPIMSIRKIEKSCTC